MPAPTITTLPDAPSTADPANFATKADAHVASLPTFVSELNDFGDYLTSIGLDQGVNSITSSRSLALTDVGDIGLVDTSSGNVVLTIDPNATTAYDVPFLCGMILTDATNTFTVTGGTGVTVNGVSAGSGVVVSAAGSEISILQTATNTWWVVGDIGVFA